MIDMRRCVTGQEDGFGEGPSLCRSRHIVYECNSSGKGKLMLINELTPICWGQRPTICSLECVDYDIYLRRFVRRGPRSRVNHISRCCIAVRVHSLNA